jgi:hypothetical protein
MLAFAETEEALNAFLDEYDGVILDEDVSGASGGAARSAAFDLEPKLARVTPKDLDKEAIEEQIRLINPGRAGSFKVSDLGGMKLLGSVAEAKLTEGIKATPHWVNYEEAFAYGPVYALGEYLTPNCSYQLMQELQLIEQLARRETATEQALQQLGQTIGDLSECETPLPQYGLVDGLVLDEIEPGSFGIRRSLRRPSACSPASPSSRQDKAAWP